MHSLVNNLVNILIGIVKEEVLVFAKLLTFKIAHNLFIYRLLGMQPIDFTIFKGQLFNLKGCKGKKHTDP